MQTIQEDILSAAFDVYKSQDFSAYETLEKYLHDIEPSNSKQLLFYKYYWSSFLLYQKSLSHMCLGNFYMAKEPLQEVVKLLKKIKIRDAEVNALLGLAAGLNLKYVPRQEIFTSIAIVNESNSAASLEDNKNIRALYANAISDYYTPSQYGGGKKAEALIKALSLPPSKGTKYQRYKYQRHKVPKAQSTKGTKYQRHKVPKIQVPKIQVPKAQACQHGVVICALPLELIYILIKMKSN